MKALLRSSLICLLSASMVMAQSSDATQSTAGSQSKPKRTAARHGAKPGAADTGGRRNGRADARDGGKLTKASRERQRPEFFGAQNSGR